MKCFFHGTHGLGACEGRVSPAGGSRDSRSLPIAHDHGYCEKHKSSNISRARVKSIRKS